MTERIPLAEEYQQVIDRVERSAEPIAQAYLQLEDAIARVSDYARREVINPDNLMVPMGDVELSFDAARKKLGNLSNMLEEHALALLQAEAGEQSAKNGVVLEGYRDEEMIALRAQQLLDVVALNPDSVAGRKHLEERTIPRYAEEYTEAEFLLENARQHRYTELLMSREGDFRVAEVALFSAVQRSLHLQNPSLQDHTMSHAVTLLAQEAITNAKLEAGMTLEDAPERGMA